MTALTIAIVLFAVVAFALRGLSEAITMCRPTDLMHKYIRIDINCVSRMYQFDLGPRGHCWFGKYHLIDGAKDGLLIVLGVLLSQSTSWVQVALVFAVGWAVYEPFYAYGRYSTWMNPAPENLCFGDLIDPDEGKIIKWMKKHGSRHPVYDWNLGWHFVRLVIIITLLWLVI